MQLANIYYMFFVYENSSSIYSKFYMLYSLNNMVNKKITSILEMLKIAEKLKMELRHSFLSNGRPESSAEHSWRLSLMVLLIAPEVKLKIDINKALKMAVIHDLVEADGYDIPAFEHHRKAEKAKIEEKAALKYKKLLLSPVGDEIYNLWHEYEEQETSEAKFIKALDGLEARLQHNEADISTWNEIEYPRSLYVSDKNCEIDKFLIELKEEIKAESRKKITKSGKNLQEVKKEADRLRNN